MALQFTRVTAGTDGKIIDDSQFDEEFKAEFTEAWEDIAAGNAPHGLKVEFPDHATREAWFNKAVAYGRQQGIRVSRVHGSGSADSGHGRLVFKMQSETDRAAATAERKARAERVVILKSHGHEPVRGAKKAEDVAAEDAILAKHYTMSETAQREHLEAWIAMQNG